ncbi:MAG: outer membrane lipoprotein-sorting protein [Thermodesulfobacteriota bacterium]|nr:outer membrane lipoprotein-sorting protein [Thermodesulfobacteriota bacterium]
MTDKVLKIALTVFILTAALLLDFTISGAKEKKTWKTVEEMSEKELKEWKIDPRWSYEIPRHKEFNYLPSEIYPFNEPFSGEEIAFLSEDIIFPGRHCKDEAAHLALVNKRGHMLQVTWMFKTKFYYDGFAEKLYKLKPGDVEVKHLLLYSFPPEERGRGLLLWDIKDDPNTHMEQNRWIYYTSLRRVRRVMGAEGEDNILEADITYDDDIMRDTWEHSHKLIGIDTLYMGNGRDKFMGEEGPYTKDGGVECYVVYSKPGAPWANRKDYYLSQWVTWYDRHTFAAVRIEQWDKKGNLFKVHIKCYENWDKMSRQPRDNRDQLIRKEWYVWDLDIDHETWARINPNSRFNIECPDNIFSVRYIKHQRFWRDDLDGIPRLKHPDEMPPKPPLWPDKFPGYRKIIISDDLKTKIKEEKRHRWLWK